MTEYTRRYVLQLSPPWERASRATARLQGRRERERERRQFKLNALAAHTATHFLNHGTSLTIAWQGRLRVTVRQQGVRWLRIQVRAWHDLSYIVLIPLVAHGLTVKLSPYRCSHTDIYVGIPNAICYSLRLAPGWFSTLLVVSCSKTDYSWLH